ncbi:MAG: hypothetical protein IT454_11390 [Planctomycetes bacterium]|nr:hypothetical protein [Planctomycetota bacterium]
MDSRGISIRPGEGLGGPATFMVFAAATLGFGAAVFVQAGGALTFLAAISLASAAGAVVGLGTDAIRLFGDEEQEQGTAPRAKSVSHARQTAAHG